MKRYFSLSLIFFVLIRAGEIYAFNEYYPPYDIKGWRNRVLKASPVIKYPKGEFRDGKLAISCYPIGKEGEYRTRVDIQYDGKMVGRINFPISRDDLSILSDIYYADVDKNGLPDIVIRTANLGSGLGTFYNHIIILLQTEACKFRRLDFRAFYFDMRDFVDLKGDGRYELLMMSLAELTCSNGKLHSFWAYVPYEFKGFNLVMSRNIYPDFPKFIWYTEKPNSLPTDKLSKRQKEDYIKTLPHVIRSQEDTERIHLYENNAKKIF